MASWQAHTADLIMRVQVKRPLSRLQGGTDILKARTALEGGSLPSPATVTFRPDTIGGVQGEWAESKKTQATNTLLYLHGGGYFACSPKTHRPIAAAYANRGFAVFTPDYRLAPEHPFPAAIEDAEAVWNGLIAQGHAPNSLSVSGDSAGGGLSLALLLSLRDKDQPLPAAAALLSPWTDLAATGASVKTNHKREALLWGPGLMEGAKFYLAGTDPKTPLASPLYGDPTGLPPLIIHVGDREILRDDSIRFADRARAAGVRVELRVFPVVPHVWQLAQFVPEARESIRLMAEFLHAAASK